MSVHSQAHGVKKPQGMWPVRVWGYFYGGFKVAHLANNKRMAGLQCSFPMAAWKSVVVRIQDGVDERAIPCQLLLMRRNKPATNMA